MSKLSNDVLFLIVSFEKSKMPIVINEIMKLFVNRNIKFTQLHISPLHQIQFFPGAENCFPELKFLCCDDTNENCLNDFEGLSRISKSIETLKIYISRCSK